MSGDATAWPADRDSADPVMLGIDIGGTKLAVGIATADGRVLAHRIAPSRAEEGPNAMIGRVIEMAREVVEQGDLELAGIAGIGIACGGPLDPIRGVVLDALNNRDWIDIPIVGRIEAALGRPAFLENDANAAALAEHRFGAGRGLRNLVYFTISTGVGGGMIIDDRLVRGETGNAGELGHLCVRVGGRPCHCGSRGCVEAYCSGTNVAERAREALAESGIASSLRDLDAATIRAEDVVAAARAGDTLASSVWDETIDILGAGIVSAIHACNPRRVILGGGVTKAGSMLFDPIRQIVSEHTMRGMVEVVEVVPADLGVLAGVLGGVAIASDRMQAATAPYGAIDWPADRPSNPASARLEQAWAEHLRVISESARLLPAVDEMADCLCAALEAEGKLIVFGNGGSAAEAQHFAAELMGRFSATRRSLPALALTTNGSTTTGIANDFSYDDVFARQVEALAAPGDVVVGITTSGRSENVVRGLRAARARGALAVAWTGSDPGPAGASADLVLAIPSKTTARIQEAHTLVMHTLCNAVDARFAEPDAPV
jgi:glucokinase